MFHVERPEIDILIQISFNEENQLYFEGHDVGKTVGELLGDSDYEYYYTVEPDEVRKIYELWGIPHGAKSVLLNEIKNRFAGNEAYSKFGQFMEQNNIKHERFTWA